MFLKISKVAAAAYTFLALSSVHAQVVNGSFEMPVTPPVDGGSLAFGPPGTIPGWGYTNGNTELVIDPHSGLALQAQDGFQYAQLNNVTPQENASGIVNTATTITGQYYALSYWVAGGLGSVTVKDSISPFGLLAADSFSSASYTTWTLFTTYFTATSGFTKLAFDADKATGVALDNISISAVPEPETYAMLLAGLAIVGGMARRRKA